MVVNKDSQEVAAFMHAFAQLRNLIDDEPNGLYEMAIDDDDAPLRELCEKVYWAAFGITKTNKNRRELFASPVDPQFIGIWSIYEDRYEGTLSKINTDKIAKLLSLEFTDFPELPESDSQRNRTPLEIMWENADYEAGEKVDQLKVVLEFVSEELDFDDPMRDEDYTAQIQESFEAWKKLRFETGLDFRGIFRKRELIPFTLIPRHVSNKGADKSKPSLINLLQQAQEAFVFGTPYAALALMRAVLETVLRDYYQAKERDLIDQIKNFKKLPKSVNRPALHRLRMRGNEILHERSPNLGKAFDALDNQAQELEVMALLSQLRHLIEGAPVRRN